MHAWTADTIFHVALTVPAVWAFYIGLPALIGPVLFRGGLLRHGLGLAVVTLDGAPARRLRVLLRGMMVWLSPIIPAMLLLRAPMWLGLPLFIVMVCAYVYAALRSLQRPDRGVQDILARTRMVPR